MSDWQLVNAEQREGGAILGYIPDWFVICGTWFEDGQWWMPARKNGRIGCPPPSHWMPLPEPPNSVMGKAVSEQNQLFTSCSSPTHT